LKVESQKSKVERERLIKGLGNSHRALPCAILFRCFGLKLIPIPSLLKKRRAMRIILLLLTIVPPL